MSAFPKPIGKPQLTDSDFRGVFVHGRKCFIDETLESISKCDFTEISRSADMAKAPAIVLTTGFSPLDNHLEALAEDINKNYNQAMDGYFKTARTVHDALAYIDDKFPDGKERETQINAFFKQTLLNGDKGTVSKLRTIGSNFPVISEYKDHIPNNATAYYLVARMEDANAWLSKAVNQKDEDKQLTPETSITELRHLIATGSKSQKLISERKLRKAFVINISDDAIGGDDHQKLEVLIEQIDEISNVEIEDFRLFQKQQEKYARLLQAEYNKIGKRLVREAIAEYRKIPQNSKGIRY